jgi:hypothetical protein
MKVDLSRAVEQAASELSVELEASAKSARARSQLASASVKLHEAVALIRSALLLTGEGTKSFTRATVALDYASEAARHLNVQLSK